MPFETLLERLHSGPPLLLDGPTGTELQRRGVETNVPGWSAAALLSAPEVVAEIHRDYVAAGAEVLTANTFRTHPQNIAGFDPQAGLLEQATRAADLTMRAVALAREAADAGSRPVWVAGSQAPIGDCYDPQLTQSRAELQRAHRVMSQLLSAAGVDLILVETHPTLTEALATTRAALETGLPVVTSFVCNRAGRLLSGESLREAAQAVAKLPVAMVAVNCLVADAALSAVRMLREACPDVPVGVYANVGEFTPAEGWRNSTSVDPAVYAAHAADWLAAGARMIGSCCGTTPEHIRELRSLIDDRAAGSGRL